MKLGENIRSFRKVKAITQKGLADIIGKSVRMVQKYESGEVTPSLEVLEDIAKALDVERLDLLVGYRDGKTSKEHREETINNMVDDFITFAKKFGYDIFEYLDNKYIISSLESDYERMITKKELLNMYDNVMAYSKFTLDRSFEKINNEEHKSPLGEVSIVEDDIKEGE